MSLILEALRKSEAERRRGEMPDLRAELPPPATPRDAPARRVLPWILAAAATAIAALALLLHPWSRGTTPPQAATVAASPAPAGAVRMQPRPRAAVAMAPRPTPPARDAAPKPEPVPPTRAPAPTQVVAAEPAPRAEAPPASAPLPPPANAAETTVSALPADLRKALPPLQLSMHMWDPDPARRFVILDGERHAEGDSVGPMRIRRIDADGVLFDWQGRPIRLPLR
jgi:general secretion pathway protein B